MPADFEPWHRVNRGVRQEKRRFLHSLASDVRGDRELLPDRCQGHGDRLVHAASVGQSNERLCNHETELRGVATLYATQLTGGPNPPYAIGSFTPLSGAPQLLDSRVAGTFAPPIGCSWGPHWEGEITLRFDTNVHMPSCQIPPASVSVEFPVLA